jgi:hypothetical protein
VSETTRTAGELALLAATGNLLSRSVLTVSVWIEAPSPAVSTLTDAVGDLLAIEGYTVKCSKAKCRNLN